MVGRAAYPNRFQRNFFVGTMIQLEPKSYSETIPTLFATTHAWLLFAIMPTRQLFLLLLCLFLSSHCSCQFSHAADTLTQGQSLLDGQTIVSAGRIFELGFFSPGKSTGRYVGIWYHDISPTTAVWVANREHPLPNSSGSITIGGDGNLIVLDGKRRAIWSSNSSMVAPNNSVVQLTDAGNLAIKSRGGSMMWQSFDHLTDTYLPGMKAGLDLKTGANQLLSSWTSDDEPAPGNFSEGVDPNGSMQVFTWEGSEPYYRSGRWDRYLQLYIGVPGITAYIDDYRLNIGEKIYVSYTASEGTLVRYVLRWDGRIHFYIWLKEAKLWQLLFSLPRYECEIYNHCGTYGVCSCSDGGTVACSCLRGFKPKYIDEWKSGNCRGGCIRRTPLMCGRSNNSTNQYQKGDGFLRFEGMKLPDLSNLVMDYLDASRCEDECFKNCSCIAFAFVDGIGCLVWDQDLVDLYQFSTGGNTLYLRLAGSELDERTSILKIAAIVTPLGAILLITFIYILWWWRNRAKDYWKRESEREMLLFDLGLSEEVTTEILGSENSRDGNRRKVPELVLFDFDSIFVATNNFCNSNKLGEGGYGPVYKGKLPDGQEIAVKRLSRSSEQGLEEFKNEVTLIARLQHRNLVRLLGCCIQGEEKMLLYEFLRNKSLDVFLFGSTDQRMLDWGNRFCIVQGIARGLLYLHEDSRLRIVHRDLKASNILLDEEMNPKISDFGMARIFGGDQNQAMTKRVVGTYGYMSPEYAMGGMFSMKSDVYSFGVILLEVVSGKKNNTFYLSETSQTLLSFAWQLWNEGRARELIDPSVVDTFSPSEALRCIRVGLLCVQDHPDDRPTMSLVVRMLGSHTCIEAMPKQPTFTTERGSSQSKP